MSITEIGIYNKICELSKRCGLKYSHVDGEIFFTDEANDPDGNGYYTLTFLTTPHELQDKTDKFFSLLGMEGTRDLIGPELEDIEDAVDRALALAPRARGL